MKTSSAQQHWQSRPLAQNPGFLPPRRNSQHWNAQRDFDHRMLTRLEYQPKHFSAKLLLRKELHQKEVRQMPSSRHVPGQTDFKESAPN